MRRSLEPMRLSGSSSGFRSPSGGAEDDLFPLEHGRQLAGLLGGRFEAIPGAKAFVPEDRPEELGALVTAWLREGVPAS